MKPLFIAAFATLMCAAAPNHAAAQDFGAAFGGFSTGSEDPIQIEADRLEVRDPEKMAVYTGNVKVRQGATVMEAPELKVFYQQGGPEPGAPGSQVTRIEAGPNVLVSSGKQTASGNQALLDMAQEVITITGNVVLTQGENIVRGQKLVVNLKTKQGRMEGGRVQTLITPGGGGAGQ